MKPRNLTAPVALAVAMAMAFAMPLAFAQPTQEDGNNSKPLTDPIHENVHVNVNKNVKNIKDYTVKGKVKINGTVQVGASAWGLTKTDQQSVGNGTLSFFTPNNAKVDGGALDNAQGNIGVNVTAGNNNVQSNSAALAAHDMTSVFGQLDAEEFEDQRAAGNVAVNFLSENNASLSGDALRHASGNIQVNVSAGNSNVQSNSLAAAVGPAALAEASSVAYQSANGNFTLGLLNANMASLGDGALSDASGNIGVNVAAGGNNVQMNSLAITADPRVPTPTPPCGCGG
jgi:hypothetical protein